MNVGLTRAPCCVPSAPVRGQGGAAVSLGLHALAGCLVILGARSMVPPPDAAPQAAMDMVFLPEAPVIAAREPKAVAAAVPPPPEVEPVPEPSEAASAPPVVSVPPPAETALSFAAPPSAQPARSPPRAGSKAAPRPPAITGDTASPSGHAAAAATQASSGRTVEAHPIAGLPSNTKPAYPKAAQRRHEQGTVIVRVLVDTDGRPRSASLERSSGHALLDDAALAKIMAWRFAPAMQGGIPVAGAATVPFVFTLTD